MNETEEHRAARLEYGRQWRRDNPEATKRFQEAHPDYHQAWEESHKEQRRLRQQERNAAKPDLVRNRQLKHRFGITLAVYNEMLSEQGGVCKTCGGPPTHGKRLAVDHDHTTDEVRGLLCQRCNLALGWYESLSDDLVSAFDAYLGRE